MRDEWRKRDRYKEKVLGTERGGGGGRVERSTERKRDRKIQSDRGQGDTERERGRVRKSETEKVRER